ncbi:AfsR/SARP family transcriptional regulator [Pseudosporangium ferrugineum]|uniref:DNA-binding SARP family transcriptional activator n=1 Tax=Pseudosporangium ferrugineum TaxID=439699 RepID=A0A2T0RIZ7_9ACTN|nr:BTAD domain-containing putative transcriptional regulator [Pseudosporangium ferrugineum]PRY21101.1 DNA-binding SARP family transcriptional activator [Pseudosporangium ferrugineum]
MYEIQLFGRLEVRTRGVRLSGPDLGGAEPRQILALLALHGEVRTSELPGLLWTGRTPARAEATVEGHLSLLRHRLDPGGPERDSVIATTTHGYALVPDRVRVDVARFDELLAVASGRTASRALPPLTAAAHLAAHPLLADAEPAPWVTAAREHYRRRLVEALLDAARHALTVGDARTALRTAEQALGLGGPGDPANSRAHLRAVADAARHALDTAPQHADVEFAA